MFVQIVSSLCLGDAEMFTRCTPHKSPCSLCLGDAEMFTRCTPHESPCSAPMAVYLTVHGRRKGPVEILCDPPFPKAHTEYLGPITIGLNLGTPIDTNFLSFLFEKQR